MWDQGPASARGAAGRSSWRKEIRIRIRFGIRIGIHSSGRQANKAGFGIMCSLQHKRAHTFSSRSRRACLSGTCWSWLGGTWFGFRRGKPRSLILVP